MDEQQTADRKAQAVKGAFLALKKHGLGDISFDLIADETGMSRQLLRYHFPDHDALMVSVCDYLAQLYRDSMIAAASALEGPKRIETFLDFYFDLLEGTPKPRDDQAYDAMMALAARSTPIRNALAEQYGLLGQVLSHEFTVQHPELNHQSASELSYLFVSIMYGHWKMVASLGYSEDHNAIARRAVDRLIASYVRKPADAQQTVRVWAKAAQD